MGGAAAPGIFKHRPTVEELNRLAAGTVIERLGIVLTEQGEDFLRGTMPVDERTLQPYGLLHGGSSAVLAETLASHAANLCLDEPGRQQAVGVELNCNHVRAARSGTVTGTARALLVLDADVPDLGAATDVQGRLVCASRLTLAVRHG